ncbi:YehR family protein [Pseudogracilibacillus sp. SE30717A]|uniref:YehR family lipoprotein n=1 Tax=Pseudogracilibacillus sp. SE30717A TaxID=3098293 RepID=UPI00300E3667
MKKWIMFGLTILLSFTLVACNSKENIVTLQTEQDGVISELTYKANGDKVTEQTAKNVLPYESIGVTTSEEAKEVLDDLIVGYDDTEGVTHNMDYQDDKVIETLTIDYETADLNEVNKLSGASFEGDVDKGISLKKSVEMLQEQGYEVVE